MKAIYKFAVEFERTIPPFGKTWILGAAYETKSAAEKGAKRIAAFRKSKTRVVKI